MMKLSLLISLLLVHVVSSELTADQVMFAVKTSSKFHQTRLQPILRTWSQLAEVWFFSDGDGDEHFRKLAKNRLINTNCSSSHERSALCCKMQAEIDFFHINLASKQLRWFCHFDDDNYVNVASLLSSLSKLDWRSPVYVGRASVSEPMRVLDADRVVEFEFATGGAGLCISKVVMEAMAKLGNKANIVDVGNNIRMPDDVSLGFVVNHLLGVPLTNNPLFHSHLEPLALIPEQELSNQITLSYGWIRSSRGSSLNRVALQSSDAEDESRFFAIHCHIFPYKCLLNRP